MRHHVYQLLFNYYKIYKPKKKVRKNMYSAINITLKFTFLDIISQRCVLCLQLV